VRVQAERDPTGSPIRDEGGRVRVRLAGGASGQGSHVLSALATADALAVIPEAHDALPAGSEVDLWWLDRA
jgi:molybdopterin biosynthesis enzyme